MVAAVVVAVGIMMVSAEPISAFVNRHPTVKMLALSFLLLIGVSLVAEGFGMHIPKGYIYFAMGFSVFVEMINLRVRKGAPVKLHQPYVGESRRMSDPRRDGDRQIQPDPRRRTLTARCDRPLRLAHGQRMVAALDGMNVDRARRDRRARGGCRPARRTSRACPARSASGR